MSQKASVIVPRNCTDMYIPSPENRKSLTIIETICASGYAIPPYIILEGKRQMCYYFKDNMDHSTVIDFSDTGLTNNAIGLKYLGHFIKHATDDGKKPALLLYDGAGPHTTEEFDECAKVSNSNVMILSMEINIRTEKGGYLTPLSSTPHAHYAAA
jgi:hypothetical protein